MKQRSVIRQYRAKYGMTQEELANKLDVSIVTIRSWEKKLTAPSVNMLLKLNDLLGATLNELVEDYQKEEE